MTQKTNEQGQKVYEVLSEEYIQLLEYKLAWLLGRCDIHPSTYIDQIKELESHIEDLKCELDEPINIDGMTDWRDSQIN